ncbi:A-kinase anchor protein inhibitor 1, partial [Strix aluco]
LDCDSFICLSEGTGCLQRCGRSLAAGNLCIAILLEYSRKGEKPGTEQDEVKLQNASKQIVQTAILRAVQQVSQESQQKEKRTNSGTSLQLERGKLTKKHEKK